METRVLRYFIEIARCGSMTKAAEVLHVSQSALSKQMNSLEEKLGKKLFRRGSRNVFLTEEGLIFKKRAEDIVDMIDKTKKEFETMSDLQGGDVYLGCAESYLMSYVAKKIKELKKRYPLFKYHIISGDRLVVIDRLDRGLLDFGVVVERPNPDKYSFIELPGSNKWGVIMRKDHELANKEKIMVEDLYGYELICSEQSIEVDISRWCGKKVDKLNFIGTTNLAYNGSIFVKEGLGLMLCLEHLTDKGFDDDLVFKYLYPTLENKLYLIWNKYQVFSPIANKFLEMF